jgi:voltage-gated potassium channel Kch
VTALRDFFITLFFVALGMTIPVPGGSVIALAAVLTAFTLISRFVTVLPALYLMRQGIRTGTLPAINLAQISEFSLVLIQVGVQSYQVTPQAASAASFAFVVLAVLSTFMMTRSAQISRATVRGLKRVGLHDLDDVAAADGEGDHDARRILLLGFYRAASSFLAEVERRQPDLLKEICVVDFNPTVFHELRARNVKVTYGDISHTETLSHASIADAEIVISSVPDSLLKGTTNEKLVHYTHSINPGARVIATAETMAQADALYAAGAAYVVVARIAEAAELVDVVNAANEGLLDELRAKLEPRLHNRREVLP